MRLSYKQLLAGVGVTAVTLAGCSSATQQPAEQTTSQMQGEVEEMARAMESGEPVVCNLTSADGEVMTYQAKDGKFRVAAATGPGGEMGYTINDGETMYFWMEGEMEGMMMRVPDETEVEQMAEENAPENEQLPDVTTQEDVLAMQNEGYAVDCQEQAVSDDEFTPPQDVNFIDWQAQMQEFGSQLQEQMEGGIEGLDPEMQQQLNEMMGE